MRSVPALRVLCVLADSESFSSAAATLGMTQSAVSQHVTALERHAALPLVRRGARPVELTPAGQVLVDHGRAVVARLAAAGADLDDLAGRHHRRIRLGGFPTSLATFVPPALALLRKELPDVSISVVDDHMQALLPRLRNRELDVALVFVGAAGTLPPGLDLDTRLTPLLADTYRVLFPRSHPMASRDRDPAMTDLAGETWVGGGSASTWFRIVRDACRTAGFDPRVDLFSDDYLAVQAFVAAGLGVAVVPGLATARRIPGVTVRTLRGPAPVRHISVARPDDPFPPSAVGTMVGLLERVTRKLG